MKILSTHPKQRKEDGFGETFCFPNKKEQKKFIKLCNHAMKIAFSKPLGHKYMDIDGIIYRNSVFSIKLKFKLYKEWEKSERK